MTGRYRGGKRQQGAHDVAMCAPAKQLRSTSAIEPQDSRPLMLRQDFAKTLPSEPRFRQVNRDSATRHPEPVFQPLCSRREQMRDSSLSLRRRIGDSELDGERLFCDVPAALTSFLSNEAFGDRVTASLVHASGSDQIFDAELRAPERAAFKYYRCAVGHKRVLWSQLCHSAPVSLQRSALRPSAVCILSLPQAETFHVSTSLRCSISTDATMRAATLLHSLPPLLLFSPASLAFAVRLPFALSSHPLLLPRQGDDPTTSDDPPESPDSPDNPYNDPYYTDPVYTSFDPVETAVVTVPTIYNPNYYDSTTDYYDYSTADYYDSTTDYNYDSTTDYYYDTATDSSYDTSSYYYDGSSSDYFATTDGGGGMTTTPMSVPTTYQTSAGGSVPATTTPQTSGPTATSAGGAVGSVAPKSEAGAVAQSLVQQGMMAAAAVVILAVW